MRKKILFFATIAAILIFGACSEEQIFPEGKPGTENTISLTVSMLDGEPTTRVDLNLKENNTVAVTWVAGDQLQLLFVKGEIKLKRVVTLLTENIKNNGKKAIFDIPIPEEITGSFNLYGVYGGGGLDNNNLTHAVLPANAGDATSLASVQSRNDVMLYFPKKALKITDKTASVTFKHLGSLFRIVLKNIDDEVLSNLSEARLIGAEGGSWAFNTGAGGKSFDLVNEVFLNTETAGNYLSFKAEKGSLSSGESMTFWGWYPPLPIKVWPELKLELRDGTTTLITSINYKPARTIATAVGKSYYFYAVWNGSELGFTTPLKVVTSLQDDMVIQQEKPLRIWGETFAGSEVSIRGDWMNEKVIVFADSNGNWEGSINVSKAVRGNFDPHTITIANQNDTIIFKNILIGDVWISSGQSNMNFKMEDIVPNSENEIAEANYPAIRLFNVDAAWSKVPQESCKGNWRICSPEEIRKFSAVAYFFGRDLFEKLQIPIGLINSSNGATACQAFTSREVLASADPEIKAKYLDFYDSKPEEGENIFEAFRRPAIFYNGMIYPLRHFSIKGFIWYQGESNKDDGMMYGKLCTAMINGWRDVFNQAELPFYFVQLPPLDWGNSHNTTLFEYALLREGQAFVLNLENTGMAVTMDVGDPQDIHPKNKKPVGIRLAKIALNRTYNYSNIQDRGPVFEKFEVDMNTVKVFYEQSSIGEGLRTNDGQSPKHFFVAGTNKVFYAATASIVGNQIWLSSPQVLNPVAVRYAFTNYPTTNFENKDGLPAWPFRTDNWN